MITYSTSLLQTDYKLGTNEYLAEGKDGYNMLKYKAKRLVHMFVLHMYVCKLLFYMVYQRYVSLHLIKS